MKAFYQSDEGRQLYDELLSMTKSTDYNTRTMYSTGEAGCQTFVEKHMKYMGTYPNINRLQYVSNLKLMTKIR